MIKKKILLLLSIMAVSAFMFGCSNNSSNDSTSSNNNSTAQESSDNTSSESDEQDQDQNGDADKTEDKNTSNSNNKNKEDKSDESKSNASIYTIDLDNSTVVKKDVTLSSVDATSLYNELVKEGVIANSSIKSFDKKDVDGTTVGFLDVSSSFMDSNLGSDAESLMLDAVAQTFKENLGVSKIKLTVDGANYSSGHTEFEDNDYL